MGLEKSFYRRRNGVNPCLCFIPYDKYFSKTAGILACCLDGSRSAITDLYDSESIIWYVVVKADVIYDV